MSKKAGKWAVELPCKLGDTAYWVCHEENTVEEYAIKVIAILEDGIYIGEDEESTGSLSKVGTPYAYLTREEAEKDLE